MVRKGSDFMNDNTPDSICKFNALYSNNALNKLKIISAHFTDYPLNFLAIYIKILELRYTLHLIYSQNRVHALRNGLSALNAECVQDICKEIHPFCNSDEQNSINTLLNFWQNMANMQEMLQMMEFMQEMSNSGDSDGSAPGSTGMGMDFSDIMNLFSAFSDPDE